MREAPPESPSWPGATTKPRRVPAHAFVLRLGQRDQFAAGEVGALADEGQGLGNLRLHARTLDSLVRRPEDGVVARDLFGVHGLGVLAGDAEKHFGGRRLNQPLFVMARRSGSGLLSMERERPQTFPGRMLLSPDPVERAREREERP